MIAATNLILTRSGFKALAQRTGFAKPVSQQLLDSRGRGGDGRMLMQYSETRILYLMIYDIYIYNYIYIIIFIYLIIYIIIYMMWYFSILQTLHIYIYD